MITVDAGSQHPLSKLHSNVPPESSEQASPPWHGGGGSGLSQIAVASAQEISSQLGPHASSPAQSGSSQLAKPSPSSSMGISVTILLGPGPGGGASKLLHSVSPHSQVSAIQPVPGTSGQAPRPLFASGSHSSDSSSTQSPHTPVGGGGSQTPLQSIGQLQGSSPDSHAALPHSEGAGGGGTCARRLIVSHNHCLLQGLWTRSDGPRGPSRVSRPSFQQ
jgi:hypothetical protein